MKFFSIAAQVRQFHFETQVILLFLALLLLFSCQRLIWAVVKVLEVFHYFSGYLWPYRGILVGTDPVAVDTVCMKILEAKRREHKGEDWPISPPPKHVFLAERKYRLGHADMENIQLVKLGWQDGVLL